MHMPGFGARVLREIRRYPVPYGLAAAIAIAAVAFVVVIGSSSAGAGTPAHALSTEAAQLEAGYVKGCTLNAPEDMCECQAHEIVERDGIDTAHEAWAFATKLQRFYQTRNLDDLPREMRDTVADCLKTAS